MLAIKFRNKFRKFQYSDARRIRTLSCYYINDDIDLGWNGADLNDPDDAHLMVYMVNILQTLGVSTGDAVAYAVKAAKDRVPISAVSTGKSYNPTFFEVYGHGTIVQASHGCRRDLNVNGLNALDLRTAKPNGAPWDFSKSSDRQLAKSMIEEHKPSWVVGSPPCTFFSAWNQGINHKKMKPERVEELRKEAILHLHFMAGLYELQLNGGRHFLHEHPDPPYALSYSLDKFRSGRYGTLRSSTQSQYG